MEYTIRISDNNSEQAKSLLQFLQTLTQTKEYFFLKIEKNNDEQIHNDVVEELETRYEHFKTNKQSFEDWDDVKHRFVTK